MEGDWGFPVLCVPVVPCFKFYCFYGSREVSHSRVAPPPVERVWGVSTGEMGVSGVGPGREWYDLVLSSETLYVSDRVSCVVQARGRGHGETRKTRTKRRVLGVWSTTEVPGGETGRDSGGVPFVVRFDYLVDGERRPKDPGGFTSGGSGK